MKQSRLLKAPTIDEFVQSLLAWRWLLICMTLGALIGLGIFPVSPPLHRARATVVVNHNLEQVLPAEASDRDLFYYLARETERLEELAFSDQVLARVLETVPGKTEKELVDLNLRLTNPSDGGWHFYAVHPEQDTAIRMVNRWAQEFVDAAMKGIDVEQRLANLRKQLEGSLSACSTICGGEVERLQDEIQVLERQSTGISPYLQVTISNLAETTSRTGSAGAFAVGGLFIGLIFGILFRYYRPESRRS